jgi:hypothetical protein
MNSRSIVRELVQSVTEAPKPLDMNGREIKPGHKVVYGGDPRKQGHALPGQPLRPDYVKTVHKIKVNAGVPYVHVKKQPGAKYAPTAFPSRSYEIIDD